MLPPSSPQRRKNRRARAEAKATIVWKRAPGLFGRNPVPRV
jgi:hypothetical protein